MKDALFKFVMNLAKPLFWLTLIAVTTLSLWPGGSEPPTPPWSDKINHILAYFVLAIGVIIGWRNSLKQLLLAVGLLFAWSGVLEILQSLPMIGRTGSLLDLAANATGILLALGLGLIFLRK